MEILWQRATLLPCAGQHSWLHFASALPETQRVGIPSISAMIAHGGGEAHLIEKVPIKHVLEPTKNAN